MTMAISHSLLAKTKTVQLGMHESVDDLVRKLEDIGFEIDVFTNHTTRVLRKVVLATVQRDIELVFVSPEDLGFEGGVSFETFNARASEFGLCQISAEASLLGFGQNLGNPGEVVRAVMEPIKTSEGFCAEQRSNIFAMYNDAGVLRLTVLHRSDVFFCCAKSRWLFGRSETS